MKQSMLWRGLLGASVALGALGWWSRSHLLTGAGVSDTRRKPAEVQAPAEGASALATPSAPLPQQIPHAAEPSREGQAAGAADALEPAPDLASSLATLSQELPELEPQLTRYERAVLQARERIADYERRVQAQQQAVIEGRARPGEELALAQEREQLLARARELGRDALALNEEIRSAAGMPHD